MPKFEVVAPFQPAGDQPRAIEQLSRALARVKADPRFVAFALVRVPLLSVMPVTPEQWEALLAL